MVEEGTEWIYSLYLKDTFTIALRDQVYLGGWGESRMTPKYLGYAACGVLLSWNQKIGGREAINLIRDMTAKWRW